MVAADSRASMGGYICKDFAVFNRVLVLIFEQHPPSLQMVKTIEQFIFIRMYTTFYFYTKERQHFIIECYIDQRGIFLDSGYFQILVIFVNDLPVQTILPRQHNLEKHSCNWLQVVGMSVCSIWLMGTAVQGQDHRPGLDIFSSILEFCSASIFLVTSRRTSLGISVFQTQQKHRGKTRNKIGGQ